MGNSRGCREASKTEIWVTMGGQQPNDYPLTFFSNVTPPAAAPANPAKHQRGDEYPADEEMDAFER